MIRTYIACACALFGSIVGIILFFQGQPFLAIEAILGGVCLGLAFYIGFIKFLLGHTFKMLAGASLIIGILGFFNKASSNADIEGAYLSALDSFVSATSKCIPAELQQAGMMACTLQGQKNAMSATSDATKALYLAPVLKLGDATHTAFQAQPKDKCAQAFKNAYAVCPTAFSTMTSAEIKALNKVLE